MNLKSIIASVLFIRGEPLTVARLAKVTGAMAADIESALRELQAEHREQGIVLLEIGGEWQLATHPLNRAAVEKLVTGELAGELSRAALEVLAIIAYRGPATRARIEYIRGVDSSSSLRNLLLRGLIMREESPRDRRAYLYRASTDFLKHLGLQAESELPEYESLASADIPAPHPAAGTEPEA